MRNISALQGPIPRTVDNRVTTSSSLSRDSPRGSRTTVPSRTLAARSRSDAILLPERPADRITSSDRPSILSGVTSSPRAAMSRPWMAAAAAPASCW